MRLFFILSLLFACIPLAYSQTGTGKLQVTFTCSLEEHDKRLFGYHGKEQLQARNPGIFGTQAYSISALHRIKTVGNFTFSAGLGLEFEKATFDRPVDLYYFQPVNPDITVKYEKYKKWMSNVPVLVEYNVNDDVSIFTLINSKFIFRKRFDGTSGPFPLTETKLGYDSTELTLGVSFKSGNLRVSPFIRAFNMQRIDEAIFDYYLIRDPRVDQKVEYNYHFKLGIMVSIGI